ncbi:MAG: hypothetical protein RJA98_1318 [Pseudomonadota bacterium]|jgi:hypothetical protein
MKTACHYAIVRFMPFVETEEFANVGVVLFAPEGRYFGFRLLSQRTSRITNFFEHLEAASYRAFMRDLQQELERVSATFKSIGTERSGSRPAEAEAWALWSELIKPRATLVRFGEGRVVLASDPATQVSALFGHYVERNFVTREYREQVLERNIRQVLRAADLAKRFQPARVGNEEYHAQFPFVQLAGDTPVKAIKALTLSQADPAKIIDHGGQWVMRVTQLRKRGLLPEQLLFAVDDEPGASGLRAQAREEVLAELRHLKVEVTGLGADPRLLAFARG